MNLTIVTLVFISAFLHVAWNMLGKNGSPSAAFFFIASLASVIVLLPLLLILGFDFSIYWQSWIYLAVSGFCQAVYYAGLAGAYETGEISIAYPLARALPVLFVPLITILMGQKDTLSFHSLTGMGIIFSGCLILPMQNLKSFSIKTYLQPFTLFALLAAIATSAYTIIDSAGIKLLLKLLTQTISKESIIYVLMPEFINENLIIIDTTLKAVYYFTVQMAYVVLYYGIYFIFNRNEQLKLKKILKYEKLSASSAGLMVAAAYIIILIAYPLASNVSYITAFRQISIPMGAVAGIILLKERKNIFKSAGVFLIFAGLIMVYI